jgi:hypothetical protein
MAEDNVNEFGQEVVEVVKKDFYVDDLLKSIPNEAKAIQLTSDLRELLLKGGFRLTKFSSTSKDVLATLPASERANSSMNLDLDKLPTERALGIQWNVDDDVFQFKVTNVDKPETKRGMLSTVASLYDPLGFIAPVMLLGKIQLQRLCQLKLTWDQQLPDEELRKWRKWKNALSLLSKVNVPRCIKDTVQVEQTKSKEDKVLKDIQLHTFSDASEKGYGCASYFRSEFKDGSIACTLAFGKARTAPLRKISIPRLELQAAVLAVRISEMIQREVQINFSKIIYWTDSEVVLKYIMNENKRFTVFVGNRVAEIREKSELDQWRYCPSEENPSDDASRGLSPSQLTTDCRWLNGPSFLKGAESAWPKTSLGNLEDDDYSGENEIQRSMVFGIDIPVLHQLLERYSTWSLLREKVVWLTRFKLYLCRRISSLYSCPRENPGSEELRTAENDILRLVQRHVYAEEYQHLSEGNECVKSSSNIAKLSPFIGEDSLIRVGSRLENAPLSYDAKFPPIIPKQHWIAQLMARDVHYNNAHSGQEHTLNLLRQRVWICHARSLVRKIINKCFVCRKGNAPTLTQ